MRLACKKSILPPSHNNIHSFCFCPSYKSMYFLILESFFLLIKWDLFPPNNTSITFTYDISFTLLIVHHVQQKIYTLVGRMPWSSIFYHWYTLQIFIRHSINNSTFIYARKRVLLIHNLQIKMFVIWSIPVDAFTSSNILYNFKTSSAFKYTIIS